QQTRYFSTCPFSIRNRRTETHRMSLERPHTPSLTLRRARAGLALACLSGLISGSVLALASRRVPAGPDARDLAALTTRVKDIQATVHVTKFEAKELEKIGRDFGTPYRLRTLLLQYKQPDKLRLEGKSPTLGTALLIMNGTTRYFAVPKLRVRKTEDLENA